MNINVEKDGEKIILKVTLSPYRNRKRDPAILREVFDHDNAHKVLAEEGHMGYTLQKESSAQKLDNKFTHMSGVFVFTKEKKQVRKKKNTKNFNLDNSEKDVIESTKITVEK